MFRLHLSEHPELCGDLTKLASALLPHENGDSSYFNTVLYQVIKLIHIDEMEREFYLFFSVAEQLTQISFETKIQPYYSRNVLESILDSNLYHIIKKDGQGFSSMMEEEGRPGNFLIEQNIQEAANVVKNRTMALYDEAFQMKIHPEEAMGHIASLRSNYMIAVGSESIRAQAMIINGMGQFPNARYDGWYGFLKQKQFLGAQGWVEFLNFLSSALSTRLLESAEESKPLSSLQEIEHLREDILERTKKIAEYGIPPIDEKHPIIKTRYVVLIGKPNLGKTTIAVNWLVNVLLEGKKAIIFSEETPESVMLYEYILPVYIYRKYGFFASYEQIIGIEPIGGLNAEEIEEREKTIKMAICDIVDSGNYMYVSSLNAWKIKDDLAQIYSDFPFDYCVIDHSLSVSGGGETTPRLNALSKGLKEFKNEYKTSICLLSHPSPDAKKVVTRDGASGLTRYSKQIEGDADDVFYMFDTPELEANNLIGFIQTKGRGASKVLEIIYLTKVFEFKVFRYDASVQPVSSSVDDTISSIPNDEYDEYDGEEDFDE